MTPYLVGAIFSAAPFLMWFLIWHLPEREQLIESLGQSRQRCDRLQTIVAQDVQQMRELTARLEDPERGPVPGVLRLIPRFPFAEAAIDTLVSLHPDAIDCAVVRFRFNRLSCFSIACERCHGAHMEHAPTVVTVDAG